MSGLIKEISFDEILPVWKQKLWPQRESPIEPVSAIGIDGRYDMRLMSAKPYFWAYFDKNTILPLGVISGFQTSSHYFRSRGVWVSDASRNQGIGSKLLLAVESTALEVGCSYLWSMPRKSSWEFYKKNNFEALQEIDKFEFGPHYLAQKTLLKSPLKELR